MEKNNYKVSRKTSLCFVLKFHEGGGGYLWKGSTVVSGKGGKVRE